jgi:PadR family transcriptional regulator
VVGIAGNSPIGECEQVLTTDSKCGRISIRMAKGETRADNKGVLLQGTLDLMVLRILANGPKHGFAISRRLSEISNEWLQVDEGSLYPALYRMEERGFLRSELLPSDNNRRARYYAITMQGEEELRVRSKNWRQLAGVVSAVLKNG